MSLDAANLLLSSLSPESRDLILSQAVPIDLPQKTMLYQADRVPHYAYFLTSGLASVVTPTKEGVAAEIGFIGCEGLVGCLHLLGPAPISTDCMMQLGGTAIRVSFATLKSAFSASPDVRGRILEFVQEHSIVVGQIAGCNRLHSAEQRLSRWLLMAQDRVETESLRFTHEYLSQMIGVQRSTVTVIAILLQDHGLIAYSRGIVRILDRKGLEDAACDCYPIIKRLYNGLYGHKGDRPDHHARPAHIGQG